MTEKYGKDMSTWPKCGCGAKFVPWACGASKVLEIQVAPGEWEAILAERLPEELDDEINNVLHEWHAAGQRVSPEEIKNAIPTTLPKCGLTDIPGVAKFDFKKWEEVGRPTLTCAGWIALCRVIASKDKLNLGHILTLCDKVEKRGTSSIDFPSLMASTMQ